MAKEYADKIRTTAEALHKEYSLRTILVGILYAAIATAALIALFKLLGMFFPKIHAKVESWRGVVIRSIRIQKLELLPAERIIGFFRTLFRLLRVALSLVLLYILVPLVLGFFPSNSGIFCDPFPVHSFSYQGGCASSVRL